MVLHDAELIQRTLAGDESAFGFWVDKYIGFLPVGIRVSRQNMVLLPCAVELSVENYSSTRMLIGTKL